jgi:uncharacterized protein involved in exopolysaccharide biosynthesis
MAAPRDELPEVERASAQLFDYEQLKDYAGFVKRAVLRHKLLALGTFAVTVALALALAKLLPRSYYSQSTLLPKRSTSIGALVNPDRLSNSLDPEPPSPLRPVGEVDSYTRATAQAVMRHDNLVALVKRVNLIDRWEATRPPLLRVKDFVTRLVSGRMPDDIKLDAMVGVLEKQLSVSTDGGKVTIGILWPDPQLAYELVEAAQQSFLEARQREELSTINDALGILELHEKQAAASVKEAFVEFEQIFASIMIDRRRAVGDPRVLPRFSATDQELAQMRFLIRAKRRAIADAEAQHNRRLAEMKAELEEKRKLYAPDHPSVVDLGERVEALSGGSPQMKSLQKEERELLSEYAQLGGKSLPFPDEPVPDPYGLERVLVGLLPAVNDNPRASMALDQLRMRLIAHQQILKRIDAARMERDIAQASFKYRYTVLTPPDFPRKPVKPNARAISLGGVVAGLLLGVFAAVARDVLSGRLLESWQVKCSLDLPVLAEFEQ